MGIIKVRASSRARAHTRKHPLQVIGHHIAIKTMNRAREASIKSLYTQTMTSSQRRLEIGRVSKHHNRLMDTFLGTRRRRPRKMS